MPNRVALKIKITCALPITDASPEAFADGVKKLRSAIVSMHESGFVNIESKVTMGNVRVKDEPPTGGQSGEASTDRAKAALEAADREIDELGKRGEFGPIPGHRRVQLSRGTLHLPDGAA